MLVAQLANEPFCIHGICNYQACDNGEKNDALNGVCCAFFKGATSSLQVNVCRADEMYSDGSL